MNPTTKAALFGASLGSAASLSLLSFIPRPAAEVTSVSEEYKILSLVPYREVIGRMEADLKRLASEE